MLERVIIVSNKRFSKIISCNIRGCIYWLLDLGNGFSLVFENQLVSILQLIRAEQQFRMHLSEIESLYIKDWLHLTASVSLRLVNWLKMKCKWRKFIKVWALHSTLPSAVIILSVLFAVACAAPHSEEDVIDIEEAQMPWDMGFGGYNQGYNQQFPIDYSEFFDNFWKDLMTTRWICPRPTLLKQLSVRENLRSKKTMQLCLPTTMQWRRKRKRWNHTNHQK